MIGRDNQPKHTNTVNSPPPVPPSYHPNLIPNQAPQNINNYFHHPQAIHQNMNSIQPPPQPQRILPNQMPPQNTFHFNPFINPIPTIKEEHIRSTPDGSTFLKFKLSNQLTSTYSSPPSSTSATNLGVPVGPGPLFRSNSIGGMSSNNNLAAGVGPNNLSSSAPLPLQSINTSASSSNTTPNTTSDYSTLFNSMPNGNSPNMVGGIFQSPSSSSSSLNVPPVSPNSPQSPSSSNSSSMGSPNAILSSPTSTITQTTHSTQNTSVSTTSTPRSDPTSTNNSPTKAAKPKPNRSPSSIARRREQHREHERQRRLKQKQLLTSATEVRQENATLQHKVAQLKNELMMSQNNYAQIAISYEELMKSYNYVAYENNSLKKEIDHYKFGAVQPQQSMFPVPMSTSILMHSPPLPVVGPSISSLPHPPTYPIKKEVSVSPQTATASPTGTNSTYVVPPQSPLPSNLHINQFGSLVPSNKEQPQLAGNPYIQWSASAQPAPNNQFSSPPNFHSSHNYATDQIQ